MDDHAGVLLVVISVFDEISLGICAGVTMLILQCGHVESDHISSYKNINAQTHMITNYYQLNATNSTAS
jgi:hypothetical protein